MDTTVIYGMCTVAIVIVVRVEPFGIISCSTVLTGAGVGPSQHAFHLAHGVLPAAGAGLHVRLQLMQALAELLVALAGQLHRLLGHHQLLQVVLQDDHPLPHREEGKR